MDHHRDIGADGAGYVEVTLTVVTTLGACSGRRLVLGFGITGRSLCHHLQYQGLAFDVWQQCWDEPARQQLLQCFPGARPLDVTTPLATGDYAVALTSPGFPPHAAIMRDCHAGGLRVLSDVDLFAQRYDRPVIAITGTNGKSSLTAMTTHVLQALGIRAMACGNIGRGVLSLLQQPPEVVVMELSSYQLHHQSLLAPEVACLANIAPDHLDWHGDFAAYAQAKSRIFQGARHHVHHHDLSTRLQSTHQQAGSVLTFAATSGVADFSVKQGWLYHQQHRIYPLERLPMQRFLSVENVLAVCAILHAYQVPLVEACQALTTYPGLPHRQEWVATVNEVQWVNDSKATNAHAAQLAIETLGERCPGGLVWIAGGRTKGEPMQGLLAAARSVVKQAIFLGEASRMMADAFHPELNVSRVGGVSEAVVQAARVAEPGDWVLFSPACSSFDAFASYEQRGDVFRDLVQQKVVIDGTSA